MRFRGILAVATVVLALAPGAALAVCFQPAAPTFMHWSTVPAEPRLPLCVNRFTNTHTCPEWQVDAYNAEVERYNAALEDYLASVQTYARNVDAYYDKANAYIECLLNQVG